MHELAVHEPFTDQLTALAARHQAMAVARIELQVGTLSGVEPLLLEDAFPIASTGSIAGKGGTRHRNDRRELAAAAITSKRR